MVYLPIPFKSILMVDQMQVFSINYTSNENRPEFQLKLYLWKYFKDGYQTDINLLYSSPSKTLQINAFH